jgi:hypothetical protein
MKFEDFVSLMKENTVPGKVLNNPGGGTSIVLTYTRYGNIRYQRSNSSISMSIEEAFKAYEKFKGTMCTTNDLKKFSPKTFSSIRHGCNSTFFLMALKEMQLCDEIKGEGESNSPFYAKIISR